MVVVEHVRLLPAAPDVAVPCSLTHRWRAWPPPRPQSVESPEELHVFFGELRSMLGGEGPLPMMDSVNDVGPQWEPLSLEPSSPLGLFVRHCLVREVEALISPIPIVSQSDGPKIPNPTGFGVWYEEGPALRRATETQPGSVCVCKPSSWGCCRGAGNEGGLCPVGNSVVFAFCSGRFGSLVPVCWSQFVFG